MASRMSRCSRACVWRGRRERAWRYSTSRRSWSVRQIFKDPEGDNSFALQGVVDLDASDAAGEVQLSALQLDYH